MKRAGVNAQEVSLFCCSVAKYCKLLQLLHVVANTENFGTATLRAFSSTGREHDENKHLNKSEKVQLEDKAKKAHCKILRLQPVLKQLFRKPGTISVGKSGHDFPDKGFADFVVHILLQKLEDVANA